MSLSTPENSALQKLSIIIVVVGNTQAHLTVMVFCPWSGDKNILAIDFFEGGAIIYQKLNCLQ